MLERIMPTRAGVCSAAQTVVKGACTLTQGAIKIADFAAVAMIVHHVCKQVSPFACPVSVRMLSKSSGDYPSVTDFALPIYVGARFVMMVAEKTFAKAQTVAKSGRKKAALPVDPEKQRQTRSMGRNDAKKA